MDKKMTTADLAEWIKNNKNCVFVVDNDCWFAYADKNEDDFDQEPDISDRDMCSEQMGYIGTHVYGGDILQAMAFILNVKLESV